MGKRYTISDVSDMITSTTTGERVFNLKNISEEEGLVLRTLLNINDTGVKEMLLGDEHYWDDNLSIKEAFRIGISLRDEIMEMVDL